MAVARTAPSPSLLPHRMPDSECTIHVVPGHPRTLVIHAVNMDGVQRNFRDKTIVVDGTSPRVEFDMKPFSNCSARVEEPTILEC
jgi:hypothetical protein